MRLDSVAWWKLPTSFACPVEINVINSCAVGRAMACNLIKCCTLFGIIAITGLIFLIMYTFLISTLGLCSGTRDEFYFRSVCSDEQVDLKCEIILLVKVSLTLSMFSCSSRDRSKTYALFSATLQYKATHEN